jgi:hypothetical protein
MLQLLAALSLTSSRQPAAPAANLLRSSKTANSSRLMTVTALLMTAAA